MSELETATVG